MNDFFFTSTLFIFTNNSTLVQEGKRTGICHSLVQNISHHLASALAEHVAFSWVGFTLAKDDSRVHRPLPMELALGRRLRGGRMGTIADVEGCESFGNRFVHICHMRSIVHCMH
jgi:hypothetical protein